MRALIQRVTHGKVSVDGSTLGEIQKGAVVLLGITPGDTAAVADKLAEKIANVRIFPKTDGTGDFDTSLLENTYPVLAVSQFTLYADLSKGRRPDFGNAARPDVAEPLYNHFVEKLRSLGIQTETGQFGADMLVTIHNWGPLTLWLEASA